MSIEKIYDIIKQVLDKNDPLNLLSLGCPSDEYSQEARLIVERLNETANKNEELTDIISGIFLKQFDEPLSKDVCKKIAAEIKAKL